MTATLIFNNLENANDFCKQWTRKTLKGHTVGSGVKDVEVKIYDITEDNKKWIDRWVAAANE